MMAIHPEAPDGPTECVTLLAQAGRSMLFETQWNLPSYSEWYLNSPQHDGYNYHKVALQVLQSQAPGRWILKSPHHAIATPEILDLPDITLDAPLDQSPPRTRHLAGIGAEPDHHLHRLVSDHDWSSYITATGARCGAMSSTAWQPTRHDFADRFVDVLYADLMADPLGCVRGIYEQLGWEFTPATEAAMASWLAENPKASTGAIPTPWRASATATAR